MGPPRVEKKFGSNDSADEEEKEELEDIEKDLGIRPFFNALAVG